VTSVRIRNLGPADHARCIAICSDRGWIPQGPQWSLTLAESDTFGIDAPDGDGLAGVVVLTRYGASLAAIGMMVVATRYGGRGLGRALMEHALDAVGPATVFLTATQMGRPLYAKLGFTPIGRSATYRGEFRSRPGAAAGSRVAGEDDLRAILEVDKAAFGADRGFLLRRFADGFAREIRVREGGYAAAWDSGAYTTIGPVVAPAAADAEALIGDLAAGISGTIRVDTDPDAAELPGWLEASGLARTGETTFMAYGEWPPPGQIDHIRALMCPALG
jgi:GNAT superfamily N-acetyltransferase